MQAEEAEQSLSPLPELPALQLNFKEIKNPAADPARGNAYWL